MMLLLRNPKAMRSWAKGRKIGFVPTMGSLHDGHSSLIRRARKENDFVVVSIFVNPTQFGPSEEFKKYPRNLKADLSLLEKEKVDAVFAPFAKAMYPQGVRIFVKAGKAAKPLEGVFRPGHFDGVCTVVFRLLEIIQPQKAYFGRKDFQQALVVKDMGTGLKLPVRIVTCPTVREKDGLAESSRNVFLSPEERAVAPVLFHTLQVAKREIQAGETPRDVEKTALAVLNLCGFKVQYFSIADAKTLKPIRSLKKIKGRILIAAAALLGKTRLIDNVVF